MVKRYFGGRAEAKSFAVADHAFFGRREAALEELRWALDARHRRRCWSPARSPAGPRGLARYMAAPRGDARGRPGPRGGRAAVEARTLRDQSQGWTDDGIARAIRAVAQADADIKGAASDAAYTLERLVLTVTGLRIPR